MKKHTPRWARMKVAADGAGVVSHAGTELLRELGAATGLVDAWDKVLVPTYRALPFHFPGQVLVDLAASVADGATSISDMKVLRDRPQLFGAVASTPTAWRVLDRVSETHLPGLQAGRAKAREAAWAAGAAPDLGQELVLDIDATVVISHSEGKEGAAPTWKHTFGFHPLYCFLDRPEVSSGEALSGLLRPGNAGSNTAEDHKEVLRLALGSLPAYARPKEDGSGPRYLVRTDSAGATHEFARTCRAEHVGFSFGFPVDERVRMALSLVPEEAWYPAIEDDGGLREKAFVAELTNLLDLSAWPEGSRVVVRRERPHPGAQLTLFEAQDGWRYTAFITDTRPGKLSIGRLELRHRKHARVEDRVRQSKATGLNNFPCEAMAENKAWTEVAMAAADLVCWSKLICFADEPAIARCEIEAFRYAILHMAGKLTRSARQVCLHLDRTWAWAKALERAFCRLRAAFVT